MFILPLGEFETSAPTADHDTDSPSLIESQDLRIHLRIRECLPCSGNRERSRARNVRPFLGVKVFERIWTSNFAGDLNCK